MVVAVTRAAPIAALALVVALLAASPSRGAAARPCAAEPPSGDVQLRLKSGGLNRHAVLHVPPSAHAGDRLPLVVALHGAGGTGEGMEAYSGLDVVADGEGFAVLYPDAVPPRPFWNYTQAAGGPDDVGFIRDAVALTRQTICVPSPRVYATGISNGGSMAARLACVMSGTFAAVAPVAGSYSRQPSCAPDRPVSLLEVHGTSDASVPYSTVLPYVRGWAARDGCGPTPQRTKLDARTLRLDWGGCRSHARVAHIAVRGGIHQWPGGFPSTDSTFSGEWEVWRFLRAARLAPPGL
jgi:polyhydroxybutyrate depolymerase